MLYGSLAQRNDLTNVTDIKPAIFQLMMKFRYTADTSGIDHTNFAEVYKAADKCDIVPLRKKRATAFGRYICMEQIGEFLAFSTLLTWKEVAEMAFYNAVDGKVPFAKYFSGKVRHSVKMKARLSRIPMAEVSFPGVIGYRRRPEEIRGALEYNIASNDHSFPFLCPRQTAIIYQSIYEL
ncbi:hypothetical protein RvY_01035-2 [Ramazzottius varieornatus]|uniref:BTB domain-containing protein n=1 Tax=Ramazzottius varieornatus TaxID=947166 RepID=A0A1D1UIH7_RAMVA|nr:hypothetical protein RvY_01035-2 [Ramazzottius varieornatus]